MYGSRDLAKTAAFFEKYCGMQTEQQFHRPPKERWSYGCGRAPGWSTNWSISSMSASPDTALGGICIRRSWFVRKSFFPTTGACGKDCPKKRVRKKTSMILVSKEDAFPARTGLHRSPVGYKWKEIYQRGDEFYDWDGHAFHFFGGIPLKNDGSLALYEGKEQEEYLRELAESLKKELSRSLSKGKEFADFLALFEHPARAMRQFLLMSVWGP